MKRLILLSTASALRSAGRLPLGIACKFANAADWLEERAVPRHPVKYAGLRFEIDPVLPGEIIYSAPVGWHEGEPMVSWSNLPRSEKIGLITKLFRDRMQALTYYEPVGETSFDPDTGSITLPDLCLKPIYAYLLEEYPPGTVEIDSSGDIALIQQLKADMARFIGRPI